MAQRRGLRLVGGPTLPPLLLRVHAVGGRGPAAQAPCDVEPGPRAWPEGPGGRWMAGGPAAAGLGRGDVLRPGGAGAILPARRAPRQGPLPGAPGGGRVLRRCPLGPRPGGQRSCSRRRRAGQLGTPGGGGGLRGLGAARSGGRTREAEGGRGPARASRVGVSCLVWQGWWSVPCMRSRARACAHVRAGAWACVRGLTAFPCLRTCSRPRLRQPHHCEPSISLGLYSGSRLEAVDLVEGSA
mmetsp:Transcript_66324/g.197326  ORF Transcript_66324/g.197326 Transcript_66324/m.197326 type:complete len:241 (+) Transcript_66324:535-1257(+)